MRIAGPVDIFLLLLLGLAAGLLAVALDARLIICARAWKRRCRSVLLAGLWSAYWRILRQAYWGPLDNFGVAGGEISALGLLTLFPESVGGRRVSDTLFSWRHCLPWRYLSAVFLGGLAASIFAL